jgi:hypothetical protein
MKKEIMMELSKFSTQAPVEMLHQVKLLAKAEGKQFQALVAEAFNDLLEKRKQTKPRPQVMHIFEESLTEYDALYDVLAK